LHHDLETYKAEELSVQYGGEWSGSRSGRFISGRKNINISWIKVGKVHSITEEENTSARTGNRTPTVQPES